MTVGSNPAPAGPVHVVVATDTGVLPEQEGAGGEPGDPDSDGSGPGVRPDDAPAVAPHGRLRRLAGVLTTALAVGLVLAVLVAPHDAKVLASTWWARLPLEALAAALVLLVLRGRARRWAVAGFGVVLGLLAVLAVLDVGFLLAMNRPFDLVLDWSLLGNAADYLRAVDGTLAVVGGWVGAGLLAAGLVAALVGATRRAAGALDRHRVAAERVVAALAVVWLATALLGVRTAPEVPFAAGSSAGLVVSRAQQVDRTLHDLDDYAVELRTDRFRDVPADRLLAGLRGKDVLVTIVESYGRVALEDPTIAPGVGRVLDDGTASLAAAGFQARSAWLTSSTFGGASWLAHSTLLSGTDVDNPQRYRRLLASDRFTLPRAFGKAGWQTAAVLPSVQGEWPEKDLYGYGTVLDKPTFAYRGPNFGWSPMPDQYVLETLQKSTLGTPDRKPLMAEIALTSSHAPWAPLPKAVDWTALGDGTVFEPIRQQGLLQSEVWPDQGRVRTEYGRSVEYTLSTLVSFLQRYGTEDTVMVFLGDHQPLPLVSGVGASRDVPVTIVAKDPAVLAAVSGWGWDAGLRPGPRAPVEGMHEFRDRFLTAFTPGGGA